MGEVARIECILWDSEKRIAKFKMGKKKFLDLSFEAWFDLYIIFKDVFGMLSKDRFMELLNSVYSDN